MNKIFLFLLFLIFSRNSFGNNNINIIFNLVDSITLQPLEGVILIDSSGVKGETNPYGYINLKRSEGNLCTFYFTKIGYLTKKETYYFNSDSSIVVHLSMNMLKEINIDVESNKGVFSNGDRITLSIEKLNQIPMLFGEKDPVRSLQLLPGVQIANEASSSLYVRGGSADQNLFILDDVTIYNVNHLLGFFSVFNPEAVKEVTFYRSDFPARYGGKLSSVVNVTMRDGNKNKTDGSISISPLAARFSIAGSSIHNKLSWFLAGRRTYMDYYARLLLQDFADYDRYNFYDINAKLNYEINNKTKLYLSIYNGNDLFKSASNGSGVENYLSWGNRGVSLRLNHLLLNKVFTNTSFVYSKYKLISKSSTFSGNESISYESNIESIQSKIDIDFVVEQFYRIKTGVGIEFFNIQPGVLTQSNLILMKKTKTYTALMSYCYIENILTPISDLELNLGLRASLFKSDTSFFNLEPRLNIIFSINRINTLLASAAMTSQPLHQLSNTSLGLPTELWVPAIKTFPVEQAESFSLGYIREKVFNIFKINVSCYFRQMKNITGYKPGATFLAISQDPSKNNFPSWEENSTYGNGKSYGLELFIEKAKGNFTGWISYTLAYAKRKFDQVNFGEEFYASFDRRHNIAVILNFEIKQYKPNHKVLVSTTWIYSSPNPLTLPIATTSIPDNIPSSSGHNQNGIVLYSDINSVRLRPFHRLDISISFEKKKLKNRTRTWEFGIYNLYNNLNPFYYYLKNSQGANGNIETKIYQKSYFPIMPYISYSLQFK